MSARTPEGRLVTRILDYLNGLPRCVAYKVHADPYQRAGEPDIDAVLGGRAVKLEVKTPGTEASIVKRVTPLQRNRLRAYYDAGAIAGVVVSVEEVELLLRGPFDVAADSEDFRTVERIRARIGIEA